MPILSALVERMPRQNVSMRFPRHKSRAACTKSCVRPGLRGTSAFLPFRQLQSAQLRIFAVRPCFRTYSSLPHPPSCTLSGTRLATAKAGERESTRGVRRRHLLASWLPSKPAVPKMLTDPAPTNQPFQMGTFSVSICLATTFFAAVSSSSEDDPQSASILTCSRASDIQKRGG